MIIQDLYQRFLECDAVCTDTRSILPNSLFFALKGANFNGNKFANQALEKGAKYSIVDEQNYHTNNNTILVDNVLETLQDLATYHRKQLSCPIIALTGSNGKTTTKELINAVLATQFKTSATIGNLNNHIGVPLTLLKMRPDTEIGIVEMGANHPKEIAFLSKIAQPNYGLITNFGKAHLEGFGSLEGVIKAKSELYDYLKQEQKTIFVNSNDAVQLKQIGTYKSTYTFGSNDKAHVNIEFLNANPYVTLKYNNSKINSKLTGAYNYNNIAAAIAIGNYFKVELNNIIMAIEHYTPQNNRSQIINKESNTIIMDAYNANPTSMMAALENLKNTSKTNTVVILGDMFELGTEAQAEHQLIVDYLLSQNLGIVLLVGSQFSATKHNSKKISTYSSFEDLKAEFDNLKLQNATILIKGSRGMALERVLDLL